MSPRRVLIGENDDTQYEALSEFFSGRGFETVWVTSGPEALERFDAADPEMVLIDALLPGLAGVKVIQRLREKPGAAFKAVLMSSAYKTFQNQYEHLKKLGVDAFLAKPVDATELERVLNELFGATSQELPGDVAVGDERQWISRRLSRDGTLAETPFAKLLYVLYKFKRNGALKLSNESVSKIVYVRRGNPVFVTSSLANESLGRFLMARGMLSTDQYNTSLQEMIKSGKQHGAVLIEMGLLTPHQLYTVLIEQIREKILKIFAWDSGEYHFNAGDFELDQNMCLQSGAPELIFEGIRRYVSLARLEKFFREFENVSPLKTRANLVETGQVTLRPAEMKFYRSIDRSRSLGKILSQSGLSLTESLQLLYFLITIEAIVVDRRQLERRRRRREGGERRAQRPEYEPEASFEVADERQQAFQARVSAVFQRLGSLNHLQMLGLGRTANEDQIKANYYNLVRQLHPWDQYSAADDVTKAKADAIFRQLTEAYETLIQRESRMRYLRTIEPEPTPQPIEPEPPPKPIEPAPPESPPEPAPVAAAPQPAATEPEVIVVPAGKPEPARPAQAAPRPPSGLDLGIDLDGTEFAGSAARPAAERPTPAGADDLLEADELWESEDIDAASSEDHTPKQRIQLERQSEVGGVTSDLARILKSELKFQEGEDLLHEGDAAAAASAFREALELNPREAEVYAYLAWAVYQTDPLDPKNQREAEGLLVRSKAINPSMDMAYYFQGLISLDLGQKERAREELSRALQFNPDNERIAEELSKLDA